MSIFNLNKDIEQIVFKVSSEKDTVRLTSLNESVDDFCENLDPELKYMTDFTIKMFAVNDDGENIMDVGRVEGILFESEIVFTEALSFVELCDMVTSDVCGMAEAITDKDGSIKPSVCPPDRNIMYIKKIYIEEKCRSLGVGRYLLDNIHPLMMHSLNVNPYVCILLPYPQMKTQGGYIDRATEDVDEKLPRLIKFYEKAGFAKIEGSEYMYKKYTNELDDLFEFLHGE